MSKRQGLLLFVIISLLFLLVNRAAYKGYFQDDELNNLSWTPFVPLKDFAVAALTPRFQPNNFRPVGHFYFYAAEKLFGLKFPGYVAVLHAIHLLNIWLVWLLARRLGATTLAASAGCAFFAFHMAFFDAFWKPMYVFELLCATFCLTGILLWTRRQWVLSFVSFWLAYKSKELAVMLPVVLACYELWFGDRRWKFLTPFFAASASFGLQGLLLNPNQDNDYTFRFTAGALAKTVPFYLSRVLLIPVAGSLAVAAPVERNRRIWFGLAMSMALFVPLLFLPGRMYSAYCYVPFTGLAVALSGIAAMARPVWLALALLAWIPWDYRELRARRSETLARDAEIKTYVTTLGQFVQTGPQVEAWIFSGTPSGFQSWGVEGALKYFTRSSMLNLHDIHDPETPELLKRSSTALLKWNSATRTLEVARP